MPEGVYLKSIVQQRACASTSGRLRAVERARLDADAQHRVLALARASPSWSRSRRPTSTSGASRSSTCSCSLKRAGGQEARSADARRAKPRRRRRAEPWPINLNAIARGIQAHQLAGCRHLACGAEVAGAARDPGRHPGRGLSSPTPQGQIEELEAGQARRDTLKDEYLDKKRQAINLDLHRQQLREIDTQFGALLRAAARQVADGRAAGRHQPGRPRPRPAVRAVQAGGGRAPRASSTPSCRSA